MFHHEVRELHFLAGPASEPSGRAERGFKINRDTGARFDRGRQGNDETRFVFQWIALHGQGLLVGAGDLLQLPFPRHPKRERSLFGGLRSQGESAAERLLIFSEREEQVRGDTQFIARIFEGGLQLKRLAGCIEGRDRTDPGRARFRFKYRRRQRTSQHARIDGNQLIGRHAQRAQPRFRQHSDYCDLSGHITRRERGHRPLADRHRCAGRRDIQYLMSPRGLTQRHFQHIPFRLGTNHPLRQEG